MIKLNNKQLNVSSIKIPNCGKMCSNIEFFDNIKIYDKKHNAYLDKSKVKVYSFDDCNYGVYSYCGEWCSEDLEFHIEEEKWNINLEHGIK